MTDNATNHSYLTKSAQKTYEREYFNIAVGVTGDLFIYTPNLMLIHNGYACQPDGLSHDLASALEIKSLSAGNYASISWHTGSLEHKYKRIYYKYFKANPYLSELTYFFINQSDTSLFSMLTLNRPDTYEFAIKQAHLEGTAKIKGDFYTIDFNSVTKAQAETLLSEYPK